MDDIVDNPFNGFKIDSDIILEYEFRLNLISEVNSCHQDCPPITYILYIDLISNQCGI